MPARKYLVTLTPDERADLARLIAAGTGNARTPAHARILLTADQADGGPGWDDARVAEAAEVTARTVERVRRRFVGRGPGAALHPKPQGKPSRERKLDGAAEARLVAIACSKAPDGRAEWTMQRLADKRVELAVVDAISDEAVRRTLKKARPSRGRRSRGASRRGRAGSSSPGGRT